MPEQCELAGRECVPCKGGGRPLQGAALAALRAKFDGLTESDFILAAKVDAVL